MMDVMFSGNNGQRDRSPSPRKPLLPASSSAEGALSAPAAGDSGQESLSPRGVSPEEDPSGPEERRKAAQRVLAAQHG